MRIGPLLPTIAPALLSIGLATSRAEAEEARPTSESGTLALHRLELQLHGGWSASQNSVTGGFVGADVSFRFSRRFALGVDADWFAPFNGSGGSNPAYPLNETSDSGSVDAYVYLWPARATPASPLGEFEIYVLGGAGFVKTRPVSVVDPTIRAFDESSLAALDVSVGARFFATDRIAMSLELRALFYFDKVENQAIAPGAGRTDPTVWYSPDTRFTNALQLRLGGSFFIL